MLVLSLLVVCALFSCFALAVSALSFRKIQELNEYRRAWKSLGDSYTMAAKEWQDHYVQMDGDVDRLKDQFELHKKAFTRFRSRVTMEERRAEDKVDDAPLRLSDGKNGPPLTEEQKNAYRRKLHGQRYGLPRNIVED